MILPILIVLCFDQILVVIEPLLIDEDYYARVEGREIISNLAKVWNTRSVFVRGHASMYCERTTWSVRIILACSTPLWSDQG